LPRGPKGGIGRASRVRIPRKTGLVWNDRQRIRTPGWRCPAIMPNPTRLECLVQHWKRAVKPAAGFQCSIVVGWEQRAAHVSGEKHFGRPKMLMPSWSSGPSQLGKSRQETLKSADPVLGNRSLRVRRREALTTLHCAWHLGNESKYCQSRQGLLRKRVHMVQSGLGSWHLPRHGWC